MNRKNVYGDDQPILHALNIIGGKWRLPILQLLLDGSQRYNQLRRKLNGITNIMLTRSLQDLEEYGLIKRIQYSEIPPHVEYFLTEHTRKLIPAIMSIEVWGKEQIIMEKDRKMWEVYIIIH